MSLIPSLLAQVADTGEGTGTAEDTSTTDSPSSVEDTGESLREGIGGLVDQLGIPEEFTWLVENLLNPVLTIVLVLLVAGTLSRLAKRAIGRGVARMKEADPPRSGRRGRRVEAPEAPESVRRAQRADALGNVATSLVGVVIWSVALIMVLGQVGVNLGPLIAGAGIVGVAVGFGAQDLVKDFLSGVFMLVEDQYGVGDIIDVGEAAGVVEGITLRSTRLRAIDGTLWHVPNGDIRRVGNMTQEYSRALVDISIAYGADIDAATDIIHRVALELSTEPGWDELFIGEPRVLGVETLGPDSVDLRLLVKTLATKQFEVARELRRRIKYAFDIAEIEIPFSQRTVWLRTETPLAIGDETVAPFTMSVPDEAVRLRAIEATRAEGGHPDDDVDAALPDEPTGPRGSDRR